ncbi:cytochrome P450 [Thelonectria olida]|uniref:Cytochrome P450 n=1 Tax=Thelonectria olida TaxID=1576542 RepID=A0A9P9ARM5_9HYPO|nr:cytochrome P450 [Thelonectria olida]
MSWARIALVVGTLAFLFLLLQAHLATRRPKNYPPGPRTIPFLGNLASIPLVKSYVTFTEWAKLYGPILGLKAGPLNLVVLQDPDDIHELYDKRGHTYAGRPYNYIALNHVWDPDVGQILLFQRNDKLLKRWKRPARWFLSQQGIDTLGPIQDALSTRCVKNLVDRPQDFLETLRAWALSTPLVAITGQADVSDDLFRTYFYRQKLLTGLLEPGKTPPVDFVVPLRWVPARWAKWKRDARFVRQHQDGFYGEMVARVKAVRERQREKKPGEYVCVMERLMDEGMSDTEVKWLSGGLLDAAFDTSSAAVMNFVVAMAAHPEVLSEARREVEEVCGGKMPRGEDVGRMPYLKACMMEMFRWRPSTPLGLPHVTESDDTYKGYVIPRGTNVVINAFAMLHDPLVHADPDTFDPRRYLDDAATQTDDRTKSTWVFGAGRRKCLGEQYTMQALLTVVAKMVWALDMAVPAGTDLSVESGFEGGLMMKPKESVVVEMRVREGRGKGVVEEWERGEGELKRVLGQE